MAYKLAEALLSAKGLDPAALLDLVALGLIADVALSRAETRALAHQGIQRLQRTGRLGLHMLAQQAEADLETLTEETIGFVFAPRLNALGRLGDANAAVELLLSKDPVRGRILASQIEALNTQRGLLTDQVCQAVEGRIASDASLLRQPVLMLEHASWPAAVLGIVASRLVERYRRPAILLARGDDDVWRGSARSIEGLHITRAIAANRAMLLSFGGHPMAAGLSVQSEQLPRFRSAIQRTAEQLLSAAQIQEQVLHIDQWISLGGPSRDVAEDLAQLAPFGAGNPTPVLATRGVQVRTSRQLGRAQEHRKLVVADNGGAQTEVLWWNAGKEAIPAGKFDIAYSMRPASFRGQRMVTLTLVDFRMQAETPLRVTSDVVALIDMRGAAVPELPPDCLVWAEAMQPPIGIDRSRLHPARQLAIWTSPPGRAELLSALSGVQPRSVYLIGRRPDLPETPEVLVSRLAGLAKFALQRREGQTKVSELAAACAQKELTVRIGLEWLAAGGHLCVRTQDDVVELSPGSGQADRALQEELSAGMRSLVGETAAFRAHFEIADADSLIHGLGPAINKG
ncbi:MAG: DHHA1 domain-containing protein [Chloroflexota bacterium]